MSTEAIEVARVFEIEVYDEDVRCPDCGRTHTWQGVSGLLVDVDSVKAVLDDFDAAPASAFVNEIDGQITLTGDIDDKAIVIYTDGESRWRVVERVVRQAVRR